MMFNTRLSHMQLQKSLEEYQRIPKYVVVQKTLHAISGAIFDHIL